MAAAEKGGFESSTARFTPTISEAASGISLRKNLVKFTYIPMLD